MLAIFGTIADEPSIRDTIYKLNPNAIICLLKEEGSFVRISQLDSSYIICFIFIIWRKVLYLCFIGTRISRGQMMCSFEQLDTFLPTLLELCTLKGQYKIIMFDAK